MKIAITIRDERISSLKEMDEERVSERERDVTIMQAPHPGVNSTVMSRDRGDALTQLALANKGTSAKKCPKFYLYENLATQ
jgi:hypothetical protein